MINLTLQIAKIFPNISNINYEARNYSITIYKNFIRSQNYSMETRQKTIRNNHKHQRNQKTSYETRLDSYTPYLFVVKNINTDKHCRQISNGLQLSSKELQLPRSKNFSAFMANFYHFLKSSLFCKLIGRMNWLNSNI